MLLIKVAILTLFHPQQVTVNGVSVTRHGTELQVANRIQNKFNVSGEFQIRHAPDFVRRYKGELEITAKNGELRLVLDATEEDLVAAIVSAESPPSAPAAALEAQAIIARSWIRAGRGGHGDADFCDTTHCQHFKEPSPSGVQAARKTQGLILTSQGKPFAPAYSASCGGRTQKEIRGQYTYFEVECPICRRDEPQWIRHFDRDDATTLREHPHSESTRLAICRRAGWDALPSNHYELSETPTGLEVRGRGQGHGVGYCQKGGAGMARQGSSPAAILRHYFPGTAIISSR